MSFVMRTRGRVDNRNNYEYKSLNREKRMRELLRVTQENQEILKRITARRPEYNHKIWEKDWDRNQEYMDSIAAYPRDWWKYQQQQSGRTLKRENSRMSNSQSSSRSQKSQQDQQEEERDEENEEEEEEEKEEEKSDSSQEKTGGKKGKGKGQMKKEHSESAE